MKVKLEHKENGGWNRTKKLLRYSKQGNMYIKDNNQVYVFKNMREGTPVITKQDDRWVTVGRISHGMVFIGGKDELSYEEYLRSPEGLEQAKQLMKDFGRGMNPK